MTDQSDETIRCPACQALNPASKRFCGDCGAPLDSQRTGFEEHPRLHLPARVAAILEERFKDQKLVELETSELIADRAVRWAKLVGFFLGIPIVAFAALLSFLGIQTYGDFTEAIQATQALEINCRRRRGGYRAHKGSS